jgi:hypothetical protein
MDAALGFWYVYTADSSKILARQQIITVKRKKGFKKEEGVKAFLLKKEPI